MSIFQQYLQPPKSMVDRMAAFADLDARKEEVTARRQQNALQALTMRRNMEADEVAREDNNQLQAMAGASGGDQNALIKALRGSGRVGLMGRADAIEKALLERRKTEAAAGNDEANASKTRFALEQERHKAVLEAVSSATDQGSYVRAVQSLAARGLDVSQVPQQFSPEFVSQAGMQALTALQRLNAAEKAKDQQITVRGQDVAAGTAAAGRASQERIAAASNALGYSRLAEDRRQFGEREKRIRDLGGENVKPLPPGAIKLQNEALEAIGVASSIQKDLGALQGQLQEGKLKFGPVSNVLSAGRNMAGLSNEQSRNFGSFKSSLERLRNESLRLNSGVQTEGDAQRAWNELFSTLNDSELVNQRLTEIQAINKRATELKKSQLDALRANYGHGPADLSGFTGVAPAVGDGAPARPKPAAPAAGKPSVSNW
jgi:hypothetical protein